MYQDDYSEFVQNGIKFLDREGPENWRDLIVKDEILMHQPDKCVLGQICDDYNDACWGTDYNEAVWGTRNPALHIPQGGTVRVLRFHDRQ